MQHYFAPDLSSMNELTDTERRKALGLDAEAGAASGDFRPDMQQVEQLLDMIRLARTTGAARAALRY